MVQPEASRLNDPLLSIRLCPGYAGQWLRNIYWNVLKLFNPNLLVSLDDPFLH